MANRWEEIQSRSFPPNDSSVYFNQSFNKTASDFGIEENSSIKKKLLGVVVGHFVIVLEIGRF